MYFSSPAPTTTNRTVLPITSTTHAPEPEPDDETSHLIARILEYSVAVTFLIFVLAWFFLYFQQYIWPWLRRELLGQGAAINAVGLVNSPRRGDAGSHLTSSRVAIYAPDALQFWVRLREFAAAMGLAPGNDPWFQPQPESDHPVTHCDFYSEELAEMPSTTDEAELNIISEHVGEMLTK